MLLVTTSENEKDKTSSETERVLSKVRNELKSSKTI